MSASFPTSVKNFTPVVDGVDYPQATQVNQAYDEITAIEEQLKNGIDFDVTINGALTVTGGITGGAAALATCDGRLTATTATPVTTADVSGATAIYFTPYRGNQIALYSGTAWVLRTFAELTISLVGFTASRPYDVFAYDNGGTVTIETLVWTNATTRATALTMQDGVLVKTGVTTRRYLGTVYINATGGQTDDTYAKRYVWNYYNRVDRPMRVTDTTDTWVYNTNTIRQANGSTANQVDLVVGVTEDGLAVLLIAHVRDSAQENLFAGIGEDSTTAKATGMIGGQVATGTTNLIYQINAQLETIPTVGRHFYTWLESNLTGGGTSTWLGDNAGTGLQSGLAARWRA